MREAQKEHALIIGGGISGLLAARVLLKHFQKVTIVERDRYPEKPTFRPGVPQGRHVHQVLLKGQQVLEELFPGIETKLRAHGAIAHNYGGQTLYYYGGARSLRSSPPSLQGWYCSRLLLEYVLHQEIIKYESLEILENTEVVELLYQKDHYVSGVKARIRTRSKEMELLTLQADFVVDASGSTSHMSQWLAHHQLPSAQETPDPVELGYASCFYDPPEDFVADWQHIAIQSTEQGKRGGMLVTLENGQWMVVLTGSYKDYPPTDEAGFLAFARSLPDSALYDVIGKANPASKIYGYRREKNHRRHFERVVLPENLIVMGDAVCSFNPIYGQGMTVAALEALQLDHALRRRPLNRKGFSRYFQRCIARVVAAPWFLATVTEEHFVQKSITYRVARWYLNAAIRLLSKDQDIYVSFVEIIHLKKSLLQLVRPKHLFKILREAFHLS